MDLDEVALRSAMGERIRAERTRLGLTPEDFAARAGLHRSTLHNYESGARSPDALTVRRMHTDLGVDPFFVLIGERAPTERLKPEQADLLHRVEALPPKLREVVENVVLLATLAYDTRRNYDYGAAFRPPEPTQAPTVHETPPPYKRKR